ncbi:MAG: FAD-dependent oxidoreductase [Chloroflexi bacterium]|nr:FAD-dependent oxidoreductase [Chloroflexota bacterium]
MKHYKYLIVGSGMTADAAVRGIRELDADGSIGMIGYETDLPYARPPLSKGMWKGRPFEKVWRGTDKLNVEFHLGREVARLDPARKRVRDDRGDEYSYDKLLLATGGSPIRLPFGGEEIIYYRTLRDYERLRALCETGQKFLVIGAGFIGTEIAAALKMQGKDVTMVFLENSIGENIYPRELSQFVTDFYRKKGVDVVAGEAVSALEKNGTRFTVRTRGGRAFEVDGVVAGLGIRPNVELAKSSGIKVENGIVVDDRQRTSAPDVFAAGDVAMFPHHALGKMIRVEHEDNALRMGRQAGRNMADADEAYTHAPYFYSDMFELGYEAVGELSSKLETFADWQEPFKKGVIYYLENGRVRGVLLWNVWEKLKEAAALMEEAEPFKPEDLKGRIVG